MLVWMTYAVALGLLVTSATALLHDLPDLRHRPRRWLWVGALVVAVAGPLVLPSLVSSEDPAGVTLGPADVVAPAPVVEVPAPSSRLDLAVWADLLDPVLRVAWLASTLVLLGGMTLSALRLSRRMRRWPTTRIDGLPVRVGAVPGPVVVGVRRPAIVVPAWVLDLPAADRRLVLAHERSHVEARDPLLMCGAWLVAAAVPWNPAAWIILRRLRSAMEEDCDRRVIRGRAWAEARRYGELLVDVGARIGHRYPVPAPVAFAEGGSPLERRIRSMYDLYPPLSRIRRLLAGAGALGLLAAVFFFPRPDAAPLTPPVDAEADEPTEAAEGVAAPRADAPFTPFTSAPRLANADEVRAALLDAYPPLLRDAGIGGTAGVWIFVTRDGRPGDLRIDASSGHQALDAAALEVARIMEFHPAMNGEAPVDAWISLPVTFRAPPPPPETVDEADDVDPTDGPRFTPYTVAPDLLNRAEIGEVLQAAYPPELRDAGVGGTTRVWFFIDAEGRVRDTRIDQSSGHAGLDQAALEVASRMRFSPARNRDRPTAVWVAFPITFQVR